jgi:hypothetical protein
MHAQKPPRRIRQLCMRYVSYMMRLAVAVALVALLRLGMLIRTGVGKGELISAFLAFPPPSMIEGLGPFPLVLKFHKVAGSTVVDALYRNIMCNSQLKASWRSELCGAYDTHKNLLFIRGGLPLCTLATEYRIVAMFRRPVDRIISTLYWYPPYHLRQAAPWTTDIRNWTVHDVRFMLARVSVDRNPRLQPPLNEYTAVLGSGEAHSSFRTGRDDGARAAAVRRLTHDSSLVVGLTERMDASMVLIALALRWPLDALVYRSLKTGAQQRPGDPRHNPNAGKYGELPTAVRAHLRELLADDEAVYAAAVGAHERQVGTFADFEAHRASFTGLSKAHDVPRVCY